MLNTNVRYTVTGRYMDGQRLVAYHLVGEDGSQAKETKERVIVLIQQGLITNMRIQVGTNGEAIIRGKKINLNNLPVFDEGKQQFRNNDISQSAANSSVSVKKSTVANANQMGQYKILKRIMMKNKCLGYEMQDMSGKITRKKREDVVNLAAQKLISNAVASKYCDKDKKIHVVLRGVSCDLAKLPMLIVNEKGKIVDPTKDESAVTVRCAYMRHGGTIHDTIKKRDINFRLGEYIICGINGDIAIKSKEEVARRYSIDRGSQSAVCDDYLDSVKNYYIEIFGSKTIQMTPDMVMSWAILKPKAA